MVKHLGSLSILHYIYGALTCLFGMALLSLVFVGGFLSSDWLMEQSNGNPPPSWVGGMISGIGWFLFLLVEFNGLFTMLSGRWIEKRKNRVGSMVIAGLNCLSVPFGLLLGIFTFVVLTSDEVVEEYGEKVG